MENMDKLKELLDAEYEWPVFYTFKFVVLEEHIETFKMTVDHDNFMERPSRSGKYVSMTFKKEMDSSDAVIEIYKKVSVIPGIVSL